MALYVLVETGTGADLLARLLAPELQAGTVAIEPCGNPESPEPLARELLTDRREPVALLLDAGVDEPAAAPRRWQEALGTPSGGGAPIRVFVTVPALEGLLFHAPGVVAWVRGIADGLAELGRRSPREALAQLDPLADGDMIAPALIQRLADADVATLRAQPPVREILAFLEELRTGDS